MKEKRKSLPDARAPASWFPQQRGGGFKLHWDSGIRISTRSKSEIGLEPTLPSTFHSMSALSLRATRLITCTCTRVLVTHAYEFYTME